MDDTFNVLKTFVIEQINQRLSNSQNSDIQLRKAIEPEDLSQKMDLKIPQLGMDSPYLLQLIQEVLEYSVNTNHPYFMNQMFGKTQPIAPNTLPDGKPNPAGMQQNRRVEVKIIDNQ